MPPQTPLLLIDNVMDTVVAYPTALLAADAEREGYEADRVADYRRERTSWQTPTAAAGHYVRSDLGAAVTRSVDYLFLDRGHNLWGKSITVGYSTTGSAPFTTFRTLTVPALGTLGGDPTTTTMAVTEEGALWAIWTAPTARRAWNVAVVDNMLPIVTGVMLGLRTQLVGFSSVFDEDAGERTEVSSTSAAGYRGTDTTYSWRTIELGLSLIGATEYDSSIRAARAMLFDRNQPFVCFMDYGTRPERGWMYQYVGTTWAMAKRRVHREGRIRAREVGQSLG